ncbi:uncharacterized protein LOC143575992 [Bidens hawaiensis]|uniref:uncharacterized protein LOC143575992 n=1 Tax=Bidens hawaiensis TaxID=980011 RepID=UPI00404ADFD9
MQVKHEDTNNLKKVQQVTESESKTTEIKEDEMLRAREVVHNSSKLAIESRFKWTIEFLREQVFHIKCKIKSEMLSSNKENVCYLVFKLSDKHCGLHGPVVVRDQFHWRTKETKVFYFRPQKPWNLHNTDWVPKERTDGWMEVIVWKYNLNYVFKNDHIFVNLKLVTYQGTMTGLILRNIEFH